MKIANIEVWVDSAVSAKQVLSKFGFERRQTCGPIPRAESPDVLTSGNIELVLRQGRVGCSCPVGSYVEKHGAGVALVSFFCDDIPETLSRARSRCVHVLSNGVENTLDLLGDGTILHSLRARVESEVEGTSEDTPVVDHIAYCVPLGVLDELVDLYIDIFGFELLQAPTVWPQPSDVDVSQDGMRSAVLGSGHGLKIVLTEPALGNPTNQIQRFLAEHNGAGVQHVALRYDDIVRTVSKLRQEQVPFLPIPVEYLERCRAKAAIQSRPWGEVWRNEILVDADDSGHLFQCFTRPLIGSLFFELVQRDGATGFGANNIEALFAAVEADIDNHQENAVLGHGNSESELDSWMHELVVAARESVPFYKAHLAAGTPSSFEALPTFEKSMTSGHGRFPISVGDAVGAFRVLATSGTSGERLYVSFDRDEWSRTGSWLEHVAGRVGFTPDDVLLNTHCYGLWVGGPALDLLANRVGAGLVPVGPGALDTALELLQDGIATAISATPSYMQRLVEAADENLVDLSETALRMGFIGGESAEEPLRRKLMEKLPSNFLWIELYGLTETGGPSVAFAPDPRNPELELNVSEYHAEVLDPYADRVVALGEVGELTLTTRRVNGRTPLVRYRTRDLVRATRGTAGAPTHISRFLGRVDESLKIQGVLVYPSAVAGIMSETMPATSEWRAWVLPQGPDNLLHIEAEATESMCHELERKFTSRVGVSLSVSPSASGAMQRENHKTKRMLVSSSSSTQPGAV